MSRFVHVLLALAAVTSASAPALAQCALQTQPGEAGPGAFTDPWQALEALVMHDPDGAGPLPAVVAVGGGFGVAGPYVTSGVALWDPATDTWSPLGSGLQLRVTALASRPNGELIAAGYGATGNTLVARWNGSTWLAVPGIDSASLLRTMPNGDVVAYGSFPSLGGVRIARWNGSSWSSLGGITGTVWAMTVANNGDLIVGGDFTQVGGTAASNLARWNGSVWSPFAGGADSHVGSLRALANGNVVASGTFATIGGQPIGKVARWDGSSWSALGGTSLQQSVTNLVELANGDLAGIGNLAGASPLNLNVLRWNGTTWSQLGGGIDAFDQWLYSLVALPGGGLVAGGSFTYLDGPVKNIAHWNGTTWSPAYGRATAGTAYATLRRANGDKVVGGSITAMRGVAVQNVAAWNGTSWSPLGTGVDMEVHALAELPGGMLAAGGSPQSATADALQLWNGSSWAPLGLGSAARVDALLALPNGNLIAGGDFVLTGVASSIATWNGSSWSPLGSGVAGPGAAVHALALLPDGDVLVGGNFAFAGGQQANNIARWTGTAWHALGAGTNGEVSSMAALANGDLAIAGEFSTAGGVAANRIARWDGAAWSALGSGLTTVAPALAALPNGDVLALGNHLLTTYDNVARWNGSSWSAVDGSFGTVHAVSRLPNDDLELAGAIEMDGLAGSMLARLTTNCPATAAAFGAGCPSSGGSNTLVATTLPWVDSVVRAQAMGLPTTALVVTVTGLAPMSPALSLPSVFTPLLAPASCQLFASPDILGLLMTSTGTVESSFLLPSTPTIVGMTFYHQLLPFEIDLTGNLVQVTATNALQMTAGAF